MFETPTHDGLAVEAAERIAAQRKDAARERVESKAEYVARQRGRGGRRFDRKLDATNAAAVERVKRLSVLKPSAREVFAVRPRRSINGVMVTVPWPALDRDVESWMHARLQAAGLR